MDVLPKVYGRTSIGGMHVRPKGAWTYVLRVHGRTSLGCMDERP